jgi:hypothetical protein
MATTYRAQISEKANKKKRKIFTAALIFFIVVGGGVAFALKDSMDMSDPSDKKLAGLFIGLAAFMLFICIFGLISSIKTATKGQCLILPFNDRTKEDAAKMERDIAKVFQSPGGKERYWDEVALRECIDNYKVWVREIGQGEIIEIDTYNELKQIDSIYDV